MVTVVQFDSKKKSLFSRLKNSIKRFTSKPIHSRDGEFVQSSWIRGKIELVQKVFKSNEACEIFDKGKKALELTQLETKQSIVNKNNAEAAAAFINATKDIPDVTSIFGSLIVVKTTINGVPKLLTKVLNTDEVIALEKNNVLKNNNELELYNSLYKTIK